MLRIFRNIRKKLITENKITSYILYALGEILLVMIGILLALQVNNWNENRKHKAELKNILNTISLDLERDTISASGIIEYYKANEKNSLRIINREITFKNYKECPSCPSLVSIYRPFTIQTKGFELIRNFSNKNTIKNDTLVTNITQFYTTLIELVRDSNGFMKKEVLGNIESFKQKPWFVNWTQGKFTNEMIKHFSESEDYRKQVASHNLLAKNHLLFVTLYSDGAKKIIEKIDKRLE